MTALGGNYYGVLRLDASFPLGIPQEYGVYGGVFADIGSLWGLDDTDGSMGPVDAGFHFRSAVGVQPLRRHALRAAALHLRVPASEGELRRRRAVPVLHPDPVLSGDGRRQAPGGRSRSRRCLAAAAAPPRPSAAPASSFLFINQERLLTGSKQGQALLGRRGAPARHVAERGANARFPAFEEEERRLTEQRPTLPPEEFRKLSDAFDARVVKARQRPGRAGRARWRSSLTSAADSSTLRSRRSW